MRICERCMYANQESADRYYPGYPYCECNMPLIDWGDDEFQKEFNLTDEEMDDIECEKFKERDDDLW